MTEHSPELAARAAQQHVVVVGGGIGGLVAARECAKVGMRVTLLEASEALGGSIRTAELDGITATRHIRQKHPNVQVVVLTSFQEEPMVQGALQAGAIGYLLKNVTAAELASAVRGQRHTADGLIVESRAVL